VHALGLKAERDLQEPQRLSAVLVAKARVSSHDDIIVANVQTVLEKCAIQSDERGSGSVTCSLAS